MTERRCPAPRPSLSPPIQMKRSLRHSPSVLTGHPHSNTTTLCTTSLHSKRRAGPSTGNSYSPGRKRRITLTKCLFTKCHISALKSFINIAHKTAQAGIIIPIQQDALMDLKIKSLKPTE